jgi:REP element-mobilizing transposase RayT
MNYRIIFTQITKENIQNIKADTKEDAIKILKEFMTDKKTEIIINEVEGLK